MAAGPGQVRLCAQGINPKAFKIKFDQQRDKAEVVASVRVLAAVCTKAEKGEEGTQNITLQLCLQVKKADKGDVKEGQVLLVTHPIMWNATPRPVALYSRQATLRTFPCVAGAMGDVALRWDAKQRSYVSMAGWVPELPEGAPPTEPGKASVSGDTPTK
jgi:hypothetical protein